jgi:hypothetical protein
MITAALAGGCSTQSSRERSVHERNLTCALLSLRPTVDTNEAATAATAVMRRSSELRSEYRVVPPAFLHNILVNIGVRKKGLCFHWADDLRLTLMRLELRTLETHRAMARRGTWREHNCVVLTAVDQPFDEGILLDAWRNSGDLFWGPVSRDKYPWSEVALQHASETPQ